MMLNADRYRGDVPRGYDAHRMKSPEWEKEHEAIREFVTIGKVLDVPVGTGRFVPIYREKGLRCVGIDISPGMIAEAKRKYLLLEARVGSIFDLPFEDISFGTAVCSRLLNWFYPKDMARAIAELRRVAHSIVLSIRTGSEGEHGNYTHDLAKVYESFDGLFIAGRKTIGIVPSGTFEMFKLRPPTIADALAQFGVFPDGYNTGLRIAGRWTDHFGVAPLNWKEAKVAAEYWTDEQVGELILDMALLPEIGGLRLEMITDEPPYSMDGPLTVLRLSDGHQTMLDGRRRANRMMTVPGRYPVLVVSP